MKTKKHGQDFFFYCPHAVVFWVVVLSGCLILGASPAGADPSFPVWLEKKAFSRSMGQKGAGKKEPAKKMGHPKKEEQKTKKKRRRPMSRPAAYLLKTGNFPSSVGDDPELVKSVCWLKSPDQSYKRLVPKKTDEGFLIFDDAFQAGLYQLFLYRDAGVKDGARYHHFSSLWFRNAGEDDFETVPASKEVREGLHEGVPVFYLKELTRDKEDNFVSQKRYTGDSLPVQVLFRGKPVAGVPVTLITKQGWKKTVSTDEKGIASFLLIKEVFHNEKVQKRPEPYFVFSSYPVERQGEFEGVSYSREMYVSSLRLPVYPTPADWESKSAGFYLVVGSVLAIIFAAAIRRKRIQAI